MKVARSTTLVLMQQAADAKRAQPARTCIFCGGRPLTKEHVVGNWAGRFGDSDQLEIVHLADREGEPRPPRNSRSWSARAYDRQARVVCETCNNGWMSDLEAAVSPLLDAGELDGRPLSRIEQTLLAAWATKTTLTLNAAEPPESRVGSAGGCPALWP